MCLVPLWLDTGGSHLWSDRFTTLKEIEMIAVKFVELVAASTPTSAELQEFGLDESEIEEIHRTFCCPRRREPIAISGAPESALTR